MKVTKHRQLNLGFLPKIGHITVAAWKPDGGLSVSAEGLCFCITHADVQHALNKARNDLDRLVARGAKDASPDSVEYRQWQITGEYIRQVEMLEKAYRIRSELGAANTAMKKMGETNIGLQREVDQLQQDLLTARAAQQETLLTTLARAWLALPDVNPNAPNPRTAIMDALLMPYPELTLRMVTERAAQLAPAAQSQILTDQAAEPVVEKATI